MYWWHEVRRLRRNLNSDVNCGRTGAPGLLNRFDKQISADRSAFGFDRTDIEPNNVAVARREVEHFARSNEYTERYGAFDDLTGVKAGRKMYPEVNSVPSGPHRNARQAAVRQDLGNALASNPISLPDVA